MKTEFDQQLRVWIKYLQKPNQQDEPNDVWLNVPETCKLLRFAETTFYRKIKNNELRHSRPSTIMVWLSDIARYVISKSKF